MAPSAEYSGLSYSHDHRRNGERTTQPRATQDAVEPIAVVGYSIGFPQDITSSDALWETLMKKRSTCTKVPENRMAIDAMYHPDPDRKGQISVRRGHFLNRDLSTFDAPFFATSTTDAAGMDPQQRLLLEYTYLALENAGIPMESVAGTKTSVYTGSFSTDWQHLSFKDAERCGNTLATGASPALNANRVSWFFNLLGNSANIDSACSSSLVCLDMGVRGLRYGDEEMSIVAGSNIVLSPDNMHSLSNLNMLSPDGECYSFDERGNGYSRGEGFGVIVLKRVSDAIRNGDTIRGIIRHTGCNQDGHTSSVSLPSGAAHERLIRDTYKQAGLSMEPVRFFEAHGTGTSVGDPIEAKAFGSVFRHSRTPDDPLWVGAIKSNVGHLEGASGIAGVIKAMIILEKAIIPPNTNFEKTNSKIDTEFLRIKFPIEPLAWPTKGLRRASVNSFGNGGTNAHIILDDVYHFLEEQNLQANHITVRDPPSSPIFQRLHQVLSQEANGTSPELDVPEETPRILPFSANDDSGIKRQVKQFAAYFASLELHPTQRQRYLENLAYTLCCKRSSLPWKSFAVVDSMGELHNLEKMISPAQKSVASPNLGFVFTGQGAQWAGMGCELLVVPEFRRSLEASEDFYKSLGCQWSLQEELLRKEHSNINRPEFSQPLCTAVQLALVDLLRSFDIHPTVVIGHSSGEIAAAYSTGAISNTSALMLAYYRGVLSGRLTGPEQAKGAMISVGLSKDRASQYLEKIAAQFDHQGLVVACINSPKNVTISGDVEQIDALKKTMDDEKIFARKLLVDVAYHSFHMQPIADEYREKIQMLKSGVAPLKPVAMISSVTGQKIEKSELASPEYWIANMVSPVKFADAVSCLFSKRAQRIRKKLDLSHRNFFSVNMLVELGPHSALQGPTKDILLDIPGMTSVPYTSCLLRKIRATTSMLSAVGHMHCLGYSINLKRVNYAVAKHHQQYFVLPDLPGYSFDHSKQHWDESRISDRYRNQPRGKLDLLGKPVPDWNPMEPTWRNNIRVHEMPWVEDHVINGSLIYPGSGMVVMAIEAANQMADTEQVVTGFELKDIHFLKPLSIPRDNDGIETHLSLRTEPAASRSHTWSEFRLFGYSQNSWEECCRGQVRVNYAKAENLIDAGKDEAAELEECRRTHTKLQETCQTEIESEALYRLLSDSGFGFGPAFQRVKTGVFNDQGQAGAHVELYEWPQSDHPQPHVIHPTSLDAIFHMAIAGYSEGGHRKVPTMVPTFLRSLSVSKAGLNFAETTTPGLQQCAWLKAEDDRAAEFAAFVLDSSKSKVLVQFDDLRLTKIAENLEVSADETLQAHQRAYHIEHRPDPDLLNTKRIASYCTETPDETQSPFDRHLKMIAHKNSGMRILELGAEDQLFGGEILRTLSGFDDRGALVYYNYGNYCYVAASQSLVDQAREKLQSYNHTTFISLNIEDDAVTQDFELDAYDIVLASVSLQENDLALNQVRKLLKPTGRLFLYGSEQHGHSLPNGVSSDLLWKHGFAYPGLEIQSPEKDKWVRAHTIDHAVSSPSIDKPVVLIFDSCSKLQSQFSEALVYTLRSSGFSNVSSASLNEASGSDQLEKSLVVVLLELDHPFIYSITREQYAQLHKTLLLAHDLLWLNYQGGSTASQPEYTLVHGLCRALLREHENFQPTVVALEKHDAVTEQQLQGLVQVLMKNYIDADAVIRETEYVETNGMLTVPRIEPAKRVSEELHVRSLTQRSTVARIADSPPLSLSLRSLGMLDTLHFVEDVQSAEPVAEDEVEVRTKAIGVNFKDCLVALGQVSNSRMGLECSGIVTRAGSQTKFAPGDRITLAAPETFKTLARGKAYGACKIPDDMSFTTAAAIPAQFGTAWEVINHLARLQAGETILIHAGAGGTGQAAVQIAQHLGATVFATVGSQIKKELLMEEYKIPESHIFYSRDTSFAKGVKRATNGRGVDVVINSLAGEGLQASWECIAPYGRFVEIGKKDIMANSALPMYMFRKNVSFIGFDASLSLQEGPRGVGASLEKLIGLFADGSFHAQKPLHIYDISEVEKAFRLLQDGAIAGKIVLEVSEESRVLTTLNTRPSFQMSSEATFVLAGGLGGLGRATARWMCARGVRNLILLSRSGPRTDAAFALLEELRAQGVRVEAPACDITNIERVQEVFGELAPTMPRIKGCLQGSVVARDCLFESLEYDNWQCAVDCKTVGSWNLHKVLPSGMDFFVMLSSASGLAGVRGQTNYDAGNTFEDALARYRVAHGEKAVAFDLGAMTDDGILAENPELLNRVLGYGTLEPITRQKYFGILDYYCNPALPLLAPEASQVALGLGLGGGSGLESVDHSRLPMLHPLMVEGVRQAAAVGDADQRDQVNYRKMFAASASLDDASDTIKKAIAAKLSKSLVALQDEEAVDMHHPLQMYGVDSLLAIELRNWIVKEFVADIAVFETQGPSTLETLSLLVAGRSAIKHEGWSLSGD